MKRGIVVILITGISLLGSASAALATSCQNPSKPADAAGAAFYPGTSTFQIEIPCPAQLNGSSTEGVQGPAPGVCG